MDPRVGEFRFASSSEANSQPELKLLAIIHA